MSRVAWGLLCGAALMGSLPVEAQDETASERCVLLVSDDTSPRVTQAIQVELQLSGCRVATQRTAGALADERARELAAHAEAEVFEVARHAIRRVEPGGRELRQSVTEAHPYALAALAGWLRARPFDAVRRTPSPTRPREAHPFLLAPPGASPLRSPRTASTLELRAPGRLTPPPPPDREPLPVEERVAWELLGGVLAGVALGAASAAVAGALTPEDDPFQWWAVGLVAGGTVGVGLGVLLAGRLTGEDGDPAWTLIGALLGGALAAGMLALGYAVDRSPTDGIDTGFNFLGAALAVVAPPLFSVLAFELTVPP
ncbi:MAG: hypothetical protein AB8I08_37330 [Sandaracinaceae bacterium]